MGHEMSVRKVVVEDHSATYSDPIASSDRPPDARLVLLNAGPSHSHGDTLLHIFVT